MRRIFRGREVSLVEEVTVLGDLLKYVECYVILYVFFTFGFSVGLAISLLGEVSFLFILF